MSARECIFALLLIIAGVLVVAGVAGFSIDVARIVAGLFVAGAAWLLFGEVGGE